MQNITIKTVAGLQALHANLKARAAEDRGAVMAEYGLLLALVAVMIIATLVAFRTSLIGVFTDANTGLDNAVTP